MKKVMISAMLILSLGLVACGKDTDRSATNNSESKTSERVQESNDQANLNPNTTQPGNETTDPNMPETATKSNYKESANKLYSSLKNEIEKQDEKIDSASWENFKTDFNNRLTSIKASADNTELNGTVGYLEQLYNEYDTAIKNNVEVMI